MAAPKLPQKFGPYTLQELIARGGMAEIFRATMPGVGGFEKTVAIKKILPHLAENEEYMTMLIDEARIIVSINHANIAQVYDLGEIQGDYYIAMEYIHGIDLSTMVKELKEASRTVPVEHALFITSGIAAGLHVAHNKCDETGRPINIVHRDVSPHNILISFAGDVKIIDFGVAKARGKEAHTQLGVIKGKLLYMAPEQAMAKDIDGRADLFAMGLILYRMLTNHLPFEGDNEFQIYNHILSKEITPPRAFNPDIPEEVNQIAMMLLQRDPSKRYQDGYSAKVDLDRALQNVAPGYSISRLSRWVETDFSHLIQQRRQAQSGQNDFAPSTPSHNHVSTGSIETGGWSADWDEIDEDEDTINVSMDSPEAQAVLQQAQAERANYLEMRNSGELPAPAAPPWANSQPGPHPGQVPQPQQSGQWQQPQQQPGPYGSGQWSAPGQQQQYGAQQSGQWNQPPPYGSGQFAAPTQSGQWAAPGQYPDQSGQYPNQAGQYPNQSGQYPASQSGQFPGASQSGQYPGAPQYPGQSGQMPAQSGIYGAPSPHYQPFQGPSPLRPDGTPSGGVAQGAVEAATSGSKRSALLPVGILLLLVVIVGMLAWQLLGTPEGPPPEQPPKGNGDENAVVQPPTADPAVAPEGAAADGGAAAEAPADDQRMVGFKVDTTPEGASVYVDDKLIGTSPLEEEIPWGESEVVLRFELDGYKSKSMPAIPFSDVRRRVELDPLPDAAETDDESDEPSTEDAPAKEEKKPAAKPRRKKRRSKRHSSSKSTKSGDPSVPLLLDDKPKSDEPKSDVPVF